MMIVMNMADALPAGSNEQKIELTAPRQEEKQSCRRPALSAIVAAGLDNSIGRDGTMPWHIPDDLRRFKALTMGCPIIMGRRTWESLPKGALPGRRNIVVSGTPGFVAAGAEVFGTLEEALQAVAAEPRAFIIGGGKIYRQTLPYVSTVYLTRVDSSYADADTFFPELPADEWQLAEADAPAATASGLGYRFETWVRK